TPIQALLELGCGGGNNASHLKAHYEMTLVDRSPGMLECSRAVNPELEHVEGDMRTVRLNRTFDGVFIHDAISYMTTETDLRAALETAFVHCRPGGVALFVPDDTTECFRPTTSHGGHDRGGRCLRYLEWHFDPDPTDTETTTAFAFLLREGSGSVRMERDIHTTGLFPRATWLRLIEEVGFEPQALPFRHSSFAEDRACELFLGVKG
ncbi:MAG: class I SAM-dependent methyltransferase, partial [Planctomycetota bacterium]